MHSTPHDFGTGPGSEVVIVNMTTDFIFPGADCGIVWGMQAKEDGLFDGYGRLQRLVCGTTGGGSERLRV